MHVFPYTRHGIIDLTAIDPGADNFRAKPFSFQGAPAAFTQYNLFVHNGLGVRIHMHEVSRVSFAYVTASLYAEYIGLGMAHFMNNGPG